MGGRADSTASELAENADCRCDVSVALSMLSCALDFLFVLNSTSFHDVEYKSAVQPPEDKHRLETVVTAILDVATLPFRLVKPRPVVPFYTLKAVTGRIRPGSMTAVLSPPGYLAQARSEILHRVYVTEAAKART